MPKSRLYRLEGQGQLTVILNTDGRHIQERQLEEIEAVEEQAEETMVTCFFSHFSQLPMALKSKTTDKRIPRSFGQARKIPKWAGAIDR